MSSRSEGTRIRADLHLHSCLSPCGSLDSSPRAIARRAKAIGLDMASLVDHNTARNCPAFAAACGRENLLPVFGIEITSSEEAHILALFGSLAEAIDMGELVYSLLSNVPNRPGLLGDQPVVDDAETITCLLEKSLIGAVDLSIEEIYDRVVERQGLCIPAHIDRPMMSVASQLGFLPNVPFHAVETIQPHPGIGTAGRTLICNSDAHYLSDIGSRWFSFPAIHGKRKPFHALVAALQTGEVELHFEGIQGIPAPGGTPPRDR